MTGPADAVPLRPVVSWPAEMEPDRNYAITVDVRRDGDVDTWPYPEEEYPIGCFVDGDPLVTVSSTGSTTLVLHRFGGTYGPVTFLARLRPGATAATMGTGLRLTLVTGGGVPFHSVDLPIRLLDGPPPPTATVRLPGPRRPGPPEPGPRPGRRRGTRPVEERDDVIVDDPGAPVFFLSHAYGSRAADPTSDPYLTRFFADLTTHVNELIALAPGQDPGFLTTSYEGGQRWESEILAAVGSCQVFVGLLSAPYLRSPWCAAEWDAFSRRRLVARPGASGRPGTTAMLPVIWAPFRDDALPTEVATLQRFEPESPPDPGFLDRYHNEGLRGLLAYGAEDVYGFVVWRLAQRIAAVAGEVWVRPQTFRRAELRSRFDEDAR
jgi:hypothetical protein